METIESPGLKQQVGCHIHRWVRQTGVQLKKAILNPKVQQQGLSRIEFTLYHVPKWKECIKTIDMMEKAFLVKCVAQPIQDQWMKLKDVLSETLVVYDCISGMVRRQVPHSFTN